MSTTPNRHIPLMEPSQAQPEVVYNAAMEILDTESLEVEQSGDSPGARGVTKIKFLGSTVTDEGGGVVLVTADSVSGGGGSLELTDGSHDLTGVTKITVSGAVVGGTAGAATLTISGGGGGGGSSNVTPNTHPASPDTIDDEGEGTPGTLDAKWTTYNFSGATAVYNEQGAIVLTAPAASGVNCRYIGQPLTGSAWRVRCAVDIQMSASLHNAGILAYESATGKVMRMTIYNNTGVPTYQVTALTSLSGSGAFTTSGTIGLPIALSTCQKVYMELELASGVLHARFSTSGYDGTFNELGTPVNVTDAFTTGSNVIGIFAESQSAGNPMSAWFDWFRRMA